MEQDQRRSGLFRSANRPFGVRGCSVPSQIGFFVVWSLLVPTSTKKFPTSSSRFLPIYYYIFISMSRYFDGDTSAESEYDSCSDDVESLDNIANAEPSPFEEWVKELRKVVSIDTSRSFEARNEVLDSLGDGITNGERVRLATCAPKEISGILKRAPPSLPHSSLPSTTVPAFAGDQGPPGGLPRGVHGSVQLVQGAGAPGMSAQPQGMGESGGSMSWTRTTMAPIPVPGVGPEQAQVSVGDQVSGVGGPAQPHMLQEAAAVAHPQMESFPIPNAPYHDVTVPSWASGAGGAGVPGVGESAVGGVVDVLKELVGSVQTLNAGSGVSVTQSIKSTLNLVHASTHGKAPPDPLSVRSVLTSRDGLVNQQLLQAAEVLARAYADHPASKIAAGAGSNPHPADVSMAIQAEAFAAIQAATELLAAHLSQVDKGVAVTEAVVFQEPPLDVDPTIAILLWQLRSTVNMLGLPLAQSDLASDTRTRLCFISEMDQALRGQKGLPTLRANTLVLELKKSNPAPRSTHSFRGGGGGAASSRGRGGSSFRGRGRGRSSRNTTSTFNNSRGGSSSAPFGHGAGQA